MTCCSEHFDYVRYRGSWCPDERAQRQFICNLRLIGHHLYATTRGVFSMAYPNYFTAAKFLLDSRNLGLLLCLAKHSTLSSKIRNVRLYRANTISHQDRFKYARSPELVHLLKLRLGMTRSNGSTQITT
jgi:hypothetical protein